MISINTYIYFAMVISTLLKRNEYHFCLLMCSNPTPTSMYTSNQSSQPSVTR